MSIIALFGLFRAAKFWTAAIMALVQFLQIYTGTDLGLDQETVTAILGGVGAILVWLVPNLGGSRSNDLPKDYYPPAPKGTGMW